MAKQSSVYQNVELRKLPEGSICTLSNILDENEAWKKVMSCIPKNPTSAIFEPKYNQEHVRIIESHSKESKRACTEILFDEWGTSGRRRPTLNVLLDVLVRAKNFKAADLVAEWLNEPKPSRGIEGPEQAIDTEAIFNEAELPKIEVSDTDNINGAISHDAISHEAISHNVLSNLTDVLLFGSENRSVPNLIEFSKSSSNISDSQLMTSDRSTSYNIPLCVETKFPQLKISPSNAVTRCQKTQTDENAVINFSFLDLVQITENFSKNIGSGGFGEVFIGYHPKYGRLAVKKTHNFILGNEFKKQEVANKLYTKEVTILTQIRHKNIVSIIGFSTDGPSRCIVTDFIDGGSLKENLEKQYLNETQRINIMLGTAEGLSYLHRGVSFTTFDKCKMTKKVDKVIHGDIKSDNIMLTKDLVPKLCDFGLAKAFDQTYMQVTSLIGTKPYMAPELFAGTVTLKIDIYSFGIVILEILTNLSSIVKCESEELNIKHYLAKCFKAKSNEFHNEVLAELLDKSVSSWSKANEMYHLATKCINEDMHDRPDIDEIIDELKILAKES